MICVGLTSCSTVQDSELYQDWQRQAYGVYNMNPEGSHATVAHSGTAALNARGRSATTAAAKPPTVQYEHLTETEKNYIASQYGL